MGFSVDGSYVRRQVTGPGKARGGRLGGVTCVWLWGEESKVQGQGGAWRLFPLYLSLSSFQSCHHLHDFLCWARPLPT